MTVGQPACVEADRPLWRLTTVRTGGDADFLAIPEDAEQLREVLAWAADRSLDLGVIGSGSNLLIADEGFPGVVIKLGKGLSGLDREGDRLLCGGGARLPSVAAKAAGFGLTGLEFGINIPGTAGGAVRMNANAYGGRLGDVLESVELVTAEGVEERVPDQLGFGYRTSSIGPDQVVSRVTFRLRPDSPEAIRERLAEMREWRREAQPSGIKTFGSTFKNPEAPEAEGRSAGQLLDAAGCRGLAVGGARFSEKHANFIENMGEATTADVVAVMLAGIERVRAEFGVELEPEVQVLGSVEWPG